MRLVAGHDDTVIAWIAKIYGLHFLQHPRMALGVVDNDGILRGAFVITWRNDRSAELHVYGALSNDVLKQMFGIVFVGCKVHRLEVRCPRKSKRIRKAALKYGFRFEAVARDDYGPGTDGFVFAMTASECRWLKQQEVHHGESV